MPNKANTLGRQKSAAPSSRCFLGPVMAGVTFQERIMDKLKRFELINQLLILEKLYPDEADHYAQNRKALEYGFELHYCKHHPK